VSAISPDSFSEVDVGWLIFLNNAAVWVDDLEKNNIPFAFVLYPGGGFNPGQIESDVKLRRVLASPMLRGVVATQPVTVEVLKNFNCSVPVHYIPGVVVDPAVIEGSRPRAQRALSGALRICFASFKYDAAGRSKGYPEFIDAAERLRLDDPGVRFSVVGEFSPSDYAISPGLLSRMTFIPPMNTLQLRDFFRAQDLLISPTRRFALSQVAFDGFPTGTSVEALLSGCAIVCSDELDQNRHFIDGEELLIIEPTAQAIWECVNPLLKQPEILDRLAEAGRQRATVLYGAAAQLLPRSRIIRELIEHA
jgi:glycosyltransferase involved in cell wall biosynthesis